MNGSPVASFVEPAVPALSVADWSQSRLSSWSSGALYCGDDLPGVPLDRFTDAMIDDGSDSSWVPYDHFGLDPLAPVPMSCDESDEEDRGMEVDDE